MLSNDANWAEGNVIEVGKASGKYRNCCSIRNIDGTSTNLDFEADVIEWNYLPKQVKFSEDADKPSKDIDKDKISRMEDRGITHMYYMSSLPKEEELIKSVNEIVHVMAVEVPKSE